MATDAVIAAGVRGRRIEPLFVIVGAYVLAALLVAPVRYVEVAGHYVLQMAILPAILPLALAAAALATRPAAPLAAMRELGLGAGLRLVAVIPFACIGLAAFTTFKISIPHIVPFYADPVLADLDAWLHGGHNPGELAQAMVPPVLGRAIAIAYGPLWFLLWFGGIAFVALQADAALRRRYFRAMSLTIIGLGTIVATLLSSVGPVFYERVVGGDRFVPLTGMIAAVPVVGEYMGEMSGYLFATYSAGANSLGAGISAMPSMHLAVATLNALMLGQVARWLGVLGGVYVGLILVGSVYLGWHYAIDGYFSIAAVCLIWWSVSAWSGRRAAGAV